MFANLLDSNDAVKLEKISQPAGGCSVGYGGKKESLTLSRKTRSESRVGCRLVDKGCWWLRNEDTWLLADE